MEILQSSIDVQGKVQYFIIRKDDTGMKFEKKTGAEGYTRLEENKDS